jgi:uncharacterized protein with HEPN domain
MREAVATASEMSSGRKRADLSETMLAMALTRCLEILGEAAARLGADTREQFPDIPVARMIAMRNRLIHAYFDVDLDIVWTTVAEDLPALLPVLDKALAEIDN